MEHVVSCRNPHTIVQPCKSCEQAEALARRWRSEGAVRVRIDGEDFEDA